MNIERLNAIEAFRAKSWMWCTKQQCFSAWSLQSMKNVRASQRWEHSSCFQMNRVGTCHLCWTYWQGMTRNAQCNAIQPEQGLCVCVVMNPDFMFYLLCWGKFAQGRRVVCWYGRVKVGCYPLDTLPIISSLANTMVCKFQLLNEEWNIGCHIACYWDE